MKTVFRPKLANVMTESENKYKQNFHEYMYPGYINKYPNKVITENFIYLFIVLFLSFFFLYFIQQKLYLMDVNPKA